MVFVYPAVLGKTQRAVLAKSGKDGSSLSFTDLEGDLGGFIDEGTSFCAIANGKVSEFVDTLKNLKTNKDDLLDLIGRQSLGEEEREALTDLIALLRFLPCLETETLRIYPSLQGLQGHPQLLYGLEGLVDFAFRGEPKDWDLIIMKAFAKEGNFPALSEALFAKALAPLSVNRLDERTVFPLALAFSLLASSKLEGKGGRAFIKAIPPLQVNEEGEIDFESEGNTIRFGSLFELADKSGLATDLGLIKDPAYLLDQWVENGLAIKGNDGGAYFTVLGRAICAFIDARIYASRGS